MADHYYSKKFNSGKDLVDYFNFSGINPIEQGTGFVDTAVFTAVTTTNYEDFQDINGQGQDISGVIVLSGARNADIFRALGTPTGAKVVPVSGHANLGTVSAPVNYRIYSADPSFSGTIVKIEGTSEGFTLIWKSSTKLHF